MTETIACPGPKCDYEGSITSVAEHIASTSDPAHSWDKLEYEHASDFQRSQHVHCARSLRESSETAAGTGNYDEAIELLERALEHCEEARETTQDPTSISKERTAVVEKLERVERAKRQNRIEQLVTTAENRLDTGDAAYASGNWERAAGAYDEAVSFTKDAQVLAEDTGPELNRRAEELLKQARVRKESLDGSDAHRNLLKALRDAKEHRDAGDTAFKESNQQDALDGYQRALSAFERVSTLLEDFSFEGHRSDDRVCDICHTEFDRALESVSFGNCTDRQVCPACSRFAPKGVLPTPTDIDTQITVISDDIDSIEAGEYGVEWTSSPNDMDELKEQSDPAGYTVDKQQLIVELVGVYQSVDGLPTAEDLDDQTEHGYLVYQEQFGSIEKALQEAGFEI